MAYQFYNDTATLKLIENGQAKNLSKSLISLTVQGDDLVIGYDSEPNWLRIAYTDVTVPASASADALRDTLNGYLPEAVVATIDTTGLATSDNQTNGDQLTKITDGAGVVNTKQLGVQLTNADIGLITNTTIHGLSSAGGGTFVDVKINPSGSLLVALGDISGVDGQQTMANSLPVVIASNQSAIPISGTITANTTFKSFQTDAAARMRVSLPTTWGEYKMLNNNFASLLLEKVGTGTHTDNTNRVTMSVTSGQYAIIQTKQYHPYFNGKSQLIELTTAGLDTATNVEKSIGYISSAATGTYSTGLDGFRLFKSVDNVYSIQVWRNGTNTIEILRSSWYDKLDGSGASGMTINWANFNVFFFDFLYLGGTALRVFVMYNGEPILIHVHYYANTDTTPIFLSPNKPIRYEIRSTTGTGSMDFVCALVASEGEREVTGTTITIAAPNAGITPLASGNTYALCGVRKAATSRDIFAQVLDFEGVISTNDFINLELRLNPTVAGTFTYSVVANTPLESATGTITNTVTGGTVISNTYFSLNMNNRREVDSILVRLNSTINNTMDTLVLCATPALGSNNVKVTGGMNIQWFNQ